MSYGRVIQDSDDDDSADSDSATSIDPLQDEEPSLATECGSFNTFRNRQGRHVDYMAGNINTNDKGEADERCLSSSSGPPQVDFDRYLQSQSSIWGEPKTDALSPQQQKTVGDRMPHNKGSCPYLRCVDILECRFFFFLFCLLTDMVT